MKVKILKSFSSPELQKLLAEFETMYSLVDPPNIVFNIEETREFQKRTYDNIKKIEQVLARIFDINLNKPYRRSVDSFFFSVEGSIFYCDIKCYEIDGDCYMADFNIKQRKGGLASNNTLFNSIAGSYEDFNLTKNDIIKRLNALFNIIAGSYEDINLSKKDIIKRLFNRGIYLEMVDSPL